MSAKHNPIEVLPRSARRSPQVERLQQAYREERLAWYEQVVALHQLGMSQARIAEQVGLGHSTVRRWLVAWGPPETRRGPYVSQLDPYRPSLFQRWEAGCHHMVRLHQESVARGYKGSYASVRAHSIRRLPDGKQNGAKRSELAPAALPSRQATFLCLARSEPVASEEQETACQLRTIHPEVNLAYELVQAFAQMLRTRAGELRDTWRAQAEASHIPELQSFVQGVERDKEAVKAGLTRPESNGIVEGKVQKLKLIKRMGYGRAGFPMLRQRGLHALSPPWHPVGHIETSRRQGEVTGHILTTGSQTNVFHGTHRLASPRVCQNHYESGILTILLAALRVVPANAPLLLHTEQLLKPACSTA